jgi:hypothetical protein
MVDDIETFLARFRRHERDITRAKILFATICGWSGFYSWTDEESAAADLMGIDPKGRRRAVPDVDKETVS